MKANFKVTNEYGVTIIQCMNNNHHIALKEMLARLASIGNDPNLTVESIDINISVTTKEIPKDQSKESYENYLRSKALKDYGGYYFPLGRIGDPCSYCGEQKSTGWDHVPPLVAVFHLIKNNKFLSPRKYPCCEKCNKQLGSIFLEDFVSREEYLKLKRIVKTQENRKDPDS